jgi:4-amino-4-deoxy-L-arabinose transferase-like glycosyltransferase
MGRLAGMSRLRARVADAVDAATRRVAAIPPGTKARIVVVATSLALSAWWIARDHRAPAWDQAHYLDLTYQYVRALSTGGVRAFRHALYSLDLARGPVLTVVLIPFFLVFGPTLRAGLLVNLLVWPLLLVSVDQVATRLYNRRAGLLAMIVTATTPIIVGLSHELLVDFMLTALTMTVVWLLLASDEFASTRIAVPLGVVTALALLTKVTMPVFVIGPAAWVLGRTARTARAELRDPATVDIARRRIRNVLLAGGIALALASIWYVPNWKPTKDYIDYTTSPDLRGYAPSNPVTWKAWSHFTINVINFHLSWVFALAGVVAVAVLVSVALGHEGRSRLDWSNVYRKLCLGAWFALPFAFVSTSHAQDVRFMAAAFPAFAVVLAGAITSLERPRLRSGLTGFVIVGGVLQTLLLTVSFSIPLLPDHIRVGTPAADVFIGFEGQPLGYERLPGRPDYVTPVLERLATLQAASGGAATRVGVLQSQEAINSNTLNFLAHVRGDAFAFIDQSNDGGNLTRLRRDLATYDFILYIPPTPEELAAARTRNFDKQPFLAITAATASVYVTPKMLAMFGHMRTFPVGDGRRVTVAERVR